MHMDVSHEKLICERYSHLPLVADAAQQDAFWALVGDLVWDVGDSSP